MLILVAFNIEPTTVVPNRGAATHMGTTSYYISMDIRPILTPRVATKLLNNSVRVVVRHKRLKNTGLQCKSWAYKPVFFNLGSVNAFLSSLKMLKIALYKTFRFLKIMRNFQEVPRIEKG